MKIVRKVFIVLAASLLLISCSGVKHTPGDSEVFITSEVTTIGGLAVDLYVLQRSYDSLLRVNERLQAELASSKALAEAVKKEALVTSEAVSSEAVSSEVVKETVDQQSVSTVVAQDNAPSSEAVQSGPIEQYMLVFGSFSSFQNAGAAIRNFAEQYPVLKDRVSMFPSGEKYRVGFVDFASRESALVYKEILIKEFPEFSTTWPCKLER